MRSTSRDPEPEPSPSTDESDASVGSRVVRVWDRDEPDLDRSAPHNIAIVLDNLRSAHNVGSIFRVAETSGVAHVLTCGITAHPPHNKLAKTAMGSDKFVPTRHFKTTADAVAHCRDELGMRVLALETTNVSVCCFDRDSLRTGVAVGGSEPAAGCGTETDQRHSSAGLAIVVGNEALGVADDVLDAVDGIVEIPTYGFKNSMNVSNATAVVVFEAIRQWRFDHSRPTDPAAAPAADTKTVDRSVK